MVRIEALTKTGAAFDCGVYDQTTGKSLYNRAHSIEGGMGEVPVGNNYQPYDLGTYNLGDNSVVVWVGTTDGVDPKNVKAIYVDRFIFVNE
jgi:hypothetical protein